MKSRAPVYTYNYVIFPKIAEKVEKKIRSRQETAPSWKAVEGNGRLHGKDGFPSCRRTPSACALRAVPGTERQRPLSQRQRHTDTPARSVLHPLPSVTPFLLPATSQFAAPESLYFSSPRKGPYHTPSPRRNKSNVGERRRSLRHRRKKKAEVNSTTAGTGTSRHRLPTGKNCEFPSISLVTSCLELAFLFDGLSES